MYQKEGGKSQLDVGGRKIGHRLSPTYYTSIADIKGFRFRREMITYHRKEITRKQHNRSLGQAGAEIHSALSGGAKHLRDGLTLPKDRI